MKELKTYISEGFFTNVGANNIIKPVIDAIKDASINDKIDSNDKKNKFEDLLASILKDIETNIKKGKLIFEYIRNDTSIAPHEVTISLEIHRSNDARWAYIKWTYSTHRTKIDGDARIAAFNIAHDLYNEVRFLPQNPDLRHSIANTIKVTEIKLS